MKDDILKNNLLKIFSIVYFSDVIVLLLNYFITNYKMINDLYIFNSIAIYTMFKFLVFLGVVLLYIYISKFSEYSENILTSVTIIYGVILMNDISNLFFTLPLFSNSTDFYKVLENGRFEVIP